MAIVISALKPILRSPSSVCNGDYLNMLGEHAIDDRKGTDAAESVWCCRRTEARFQVAPQSTLRLDRARVENASPPSRSARGTTSPRPRLRRQPAGGLRPRTEASARGESAVHFGPGMS